MDKQATIITVSYNSWDYLLINYRLLEKTDCLSYEWIIVNNRPENHEEKEESAYKLLKEKKNIQIINGIEQSFLIKGLCTKKWFKGVHHAFLLVSVE